MSFPELPVTSHPFQLSDGSYFQVSGLRWQLHYWLKPRNNAGLDDVRSIMPFVDVVITAKPRFITFDYSGHTLDQQDRFTTDWQPVDFLNFHAWLVSDVTLDYLRAIFGAVKAFSRQAHRDFEVAEPPFYTNLANYLRSARQRVASVRQWQDTLTHVPGLRPEEIELSGLPALWRRHGENDKLSREALQTVLNYSASRPVLVSEAVRDFRVSRRYVETGRLVRRKTRYLPRPPSYCIERYRHASMGYRILLNRYRDLAPQEPVWIAVDEKWRLLSLLRNDGKDTRFQTLEEAKASIEADIDRRFKQYGHLYPSTRWDGYVAPGGEAYREHFLILAHWPVHYVGPHFDLPNILIHLRTTLRTDVAGRRLFFLEELQSDWHQLGKRHGFYGEHPDSPPFAPFASEWTELGLKILLWLAMRAGIDRLTWTSGQLQEWRYQRARPGLRTFYDKSIPKILKKLDTWGCQLESTEIQTKRVQGWLHTENGRCWIIDNDENRISKFFRNPRDAQDWRLKQAPTITVSIPVLVLSDHLKTHLRREGMPLHGGFMK